MDALKKQLSDSKASTAVSSVVSASRTASSRKEANTLKFLKKQLRHEVMHRAEVEADFEKTTAALQQQLASAQADAVDAQAAVDALRREGEQQLKQLRQEAEDLESKAATAKTEHLLAEQQCMELRAALRRRDSALGDSTKEIRRLEALRQEADSKAAAAQDAVRAARQRGSEALAAAEAMLSEVKEEHSAQIAALQADFAKQAQQLADAQRSLLDVHKSHNKALAAKDKDLAATRVFAVVHRWTLARTWSITFSFLPSSVLFLLRASAQPPFLCLPLMLRVALAAILVQANARRLDTGKPWLPKTRNTCGVGSLPTSGWTTQWRL